MRFYQQLQPKIGSLALVSQTMTGADNRPLPVCGRPISMEVKCGEMVYMASFLVMADLKALVVMGISILRALAAQVDVANGTAQVHIWLYPKYSQPNLPHLKLTKPRRLIYTRVHLHQLFFIFPDRKYAC